MGAYISLSSEIGGRALIGAWALKGTNTVYCIGLLTLHSTLVYSYHFFNHSLEHLLKRYNYGIFFKI